MSIRVQRFDPPWRASGDFRRAIAGGFGTAPARFRSRAAFRGLVIAATLALPVVTHAAGPQSPVPATEPTDTHEAEAPPVQADAAPVHTERVRKHERFGMVRYDRPVYRNGVRVLWHGAWRADRPDRGEVARVRPGPQSVGRDLIVLADAADASASRMAGELASALQSAGLHVKAVSGKTSPAALDKAVTDDLADLAIAPLDALGGGADGPTVATADWRARSPYVMRLAAEPVEVIAPRAITALDQLTGRKVSVAAADGAAAVTAAIVFARAGVAPTLTNEALPDGLGRLARGEIDAVFVVGCDSDKAVADFGKDGRFHVVAIPYAPPLRALYTPMRLTAHDRTNLIDANEKIDTIGVPMALLAIDAPPDSPRAGRLAPATERLFGQFEHSLAARQGSKWQDVNPAARIFGWPRFGVAQSWLEHNAGAPNPALDAFRDAAETAMSANEPPVGADSDRLYESLMKLNGPAQ